MRRLSLKSTDFGVDPTFSSFKKFIKIGRIVLQFFYAMQFKPLQSICMRIETQQLSAFMRTGASWQFIAFKMQKSEPRCLTRFAHSSNGGDTETRTQDPLRVMQML